MQSELQSRELEQYSPYAPLLLADLMKPLDVRELFGNGNPLEVEIGAGRGDFMIAHASSHPDLNFLAVEKKLMFMKRGINKARRAGLENVRWLLVEARYLVMEYLTDASVQAVHVYFPDPWPKKKQLKRRIVQAGFTEQLVRVLIPGGKLHVRTDHEEYFQQMVEVLDATEGLRLVKTEEAILERKTGFEARFNREGIRTLHRSYEKV